MNHILQIINYIVESFIHTWPYLLITIPIAVAVKMSGASKFINRAFTTRPIIAIFLATFVGAFSPLCSCSVIPVVAALLIGGVPLAPVMSFWLASPSMDPEIFFLPVSTLGWEVAIWRLATTLALSLGGGLITHFLAQRKWLGENMLRDVRSTPIRTTRMFLREVGYYTVTKIREALFPQGVTIMAVSSGAITIPQEETMNLEDSTCGCGDCKVQITNVPDKPVLDAARSEAENPYWKRLAAETWNATIMVIKFMVLAWFLGAIIRLYVPETWITSTIGGGQSWAIITAALLGIPIYTSNLTAMPLIGGLLAQGMHPAAALAFLIAGPTTTLPAISSCMGVRLSALVMIIHARSTKSSVQKSRLS